MLSIKVLWVPLQKCSKNLTVNSEPNTSGMFRKRQEWSYPRGRDKVILEEKLFPSRFLFRQIKPLQIYTRKFLISDTFTHVCRQHTVNRYQFHQVSPPRLDYTWFLVKSLDYQSVTQLWNVYALGYGIIYYGPRAGPRDNSVDPMGASLPWARTKSSLVPLYPIPILLRMPCVIPGLSTRVVFGDTDKLPYVLLNTQ